MAKSSIARDEGIQALVLCDLYDKRLYPLSANIPKALIPVAGVPLIEYTLEWLSTQKMVSEVILFTCQHAPAMRAYLSSSRWASHVVDASAAKKTAEKRPAAAEESDDQGSDEEQEEESDEEEGEEEEEEEGSDEEGAGPSPAAGLHMPRIRVVTQRDCFCPGDALRALDHSDFVRKDSVCLLLEAGGVVGNADLSGAIAAHSARAKLDPQFTPLTAVLLPRDGPSTASAAAAGVKSPLSLSSSRSPLDEHPVYTIDKRDGRIWSYGLLKGATVDAKAVAGVCPTKHVPKDVLPHLVTRQDFLETGVYVCSPTALINFNDHFDYRDIRTDYLRFEAANPAVPQRFHVHIISRAYLSGRISDPRCLRAVEGDLISGWAGAGVAPSTGFHLPLSTPRPVWRVTPSGSRVHPTADLSPSTLASLGPSALVYGKASVAEGAVVTGSVIGEGVTIGAGARVVNSTVLAGARVGPGAVVEGAIVGLEAVIGEGATVSQGAVLGKGVVIAAGHSVPLCARITCTSAAGRLTVGAAGSDVAGVGSKGAGRAWPGPDDELGDEDEEEDDSDDEEEDEDEDEEVKHPRGGSPAALSVPSSLLQSLRTALLALKDAQSKGEAAAPADVEAAVAGVAVASRAALSHPNVPGAPFLPSTLAEALPLLHKAQLREKAAAAAVVSALAAATKPSAGAAAAGKAASAPAAAGGGGSSSAPSAATKQLRGGATEPPSEANGRLSRFIAGVRDLVSDLPSTPDKPALNAAGMEVASFRHAENASFELVLKSLVPVMMELLPTPPTLAAVTSTLKGWSPLLKRFVTRLEEQCALVYAVEGAVRREGPAREKLMPLFGLFLNVLLQSGVIGEEAVEDWYESAKMDVEWAEGEDEEEDEEEEEGEDSELEEEREASDPKLIADRKLLLSSKTVTLLMESIQEDDEEEEEEEEDD